MSTTFSEHPQKRYQGCRGWVVGGSEGAFANWGRTSGLLASLLTWIPAPLPGDSEVSQLLTAWGTARTLLS